MFNDLPPELQTHEIERNAYNAAFHELGFRWHWDDATYTRLLRYAPSAEARIAHYLRTAQPHLLRAYDAGFLARAIEDRMQQHRQRGARPCDWSRLAVHEVGV